LEEVYQRFKDRVEFVAVYVREAHPTDGWRMSSNDRAGITYKQPKAETERVAVAKKCCDALEITMPVVVDEMDDRVGHAYSGMPDRLYVLDRDGRVAYKGGRGPFGFKVGEMEQALAMTLLEQTTPAEPRVSRVPVLSVDEAWKKLPPTEKGAEQPLPEWARMLAAPLPRTTAAMLELDYLHRARSPLDPVLRGQMRWVAAHANRCAYSEAYAAADLRRAGLSESDVARLAGDWTGIPEATRLALNFARKLTLAAYSVTDEEIAQLQQLYGDKQLVAMVLLLAYVNFQDRLLLTLAVPLEPGGPLPPLELRFAKNSTGTTAPPRNAPAASTSRKAERILDPEWTSRDLVALQKDMEKQKTRQPRIRVPSWEEARSQLPNPATATRPVRIRWSLVCMGYQPELASAWSACTRAFAEDARQDRVFEETLFWVVTRTLNCFY